MFRPTLPRFFLERGLADVLQQHARPGLKCLNLGCGPEGRYAELFRDADVDGVDLAPPKGSQPWRYHQVDARTLPFPNGHFDLVVSIEAFEHIEQNESAMSEVFRVLKPGGKLVLTTPTAYTWAFEFGRHGPHYYNHGDLARLVAGAGLRIDAVTALGGVGTYAANLCKSWISLIGYKVFGEPWWPAVDNAFTLPFWIAAHTDSRLNWPPSNFLLVATKPG